jgi:hypothetical protein
VTLDGQPLAQGRITFIAADAGVQTAEAKIAAGQYEAVVLPGEKRVEIRAPKVTGKQKMYDEPDSPTVDVVTELLPPRYNVDSTLTMTVAEGEQEKSFELTRPDGLLFRHLSQSPPARFGQSVAAQRRN